ncbi:MAG: hypothetical protein EOO36_01425 [Cytophagaceae bacterium]|nr:MAG: hypothetical protein EOO36_01425 [Cytophagaceae bacterium]
MKSYFAYLLAALALGPTFSRELLVANFALSRVTITGDAIWAGAGGAHAEKSAGISQLITN